MAKPKKLKWADAPSEHDYPAAASFLRLIASPPASEALAGLLSHAPTVHHPVKDILRAARLSLLPADDAEVAKDLKKVAEGMLCRRSCWCEAIWRPAGHCRLLMATTVCALATT